MHSTHKKLDTSTSKKKKKIVFSELLWTREYLFGLNFFFPVHSIRKREPNFRVPADVIVIMCQRQMIKEHALVLVYFIEAWQPTVSGDRGQTVLWSWLTAISYHKSSEFVIGNTFVHRVRKSFLSEVNENCYYTF